MDMTTKTPRVSVSLDKNTSELLTHLASQEKKPVAKFIKELIFNGLEMHEDYCLSKEAEKLDKTDVKMYSHDEAWK